MESEQQNAARERHAKREARTNKVAREGGDLDRRLTHVHTHIMKHSDSCREFARASLEMAILNGGARLILAVDTVARALF